MAIEGRSLSGVGAAAAGCGAATGFTTFGSKNSGGGAITLDTAGGGASLNPDWKFSATAGATGAAGFTIRGGGSGAASAAGASSSGAVGAT